MSTASATVITPRDQGNRTKGAERALGIGLAVVSGLAMATQSRLNGQLGAELHDSLFAAVISFGGGLVLLLLALPFSPKMREGLRSVAGGVREGRFSPWYCLGGVGGATYVAGQSVTVSVLGVAMFTVGVVAGQTLSGLAVDRAGLGPAGPQALTWTRVLGAVLTLAAVAWSLSGSLGSAPAGLWLLVLPLVAGALMAVQQAFNGRVNAQSGSSLTAALINFTGGTIVLVLAWLVSLAFGGGPHAFPSNPLLYLGGLVGIVFIALASVVVHWTGVLLLGLATIAGQLIGSVLLDLIVPAHPATLGAATFGGTGLALVAVGIAAISTRPRQG
ncbi:DMT family transporter [Amycolatopsis minnesotensis]|uniref:DMT family transporter n=2 Tax=Amycolatopsis minnesotensis TaxID=337894 RepID=A0ABN2QBV1_9PSEU